MNCYGSGLQPNGVIQGKPAEFVIDTKKAGVAPLDVKVINSRKKIPVQYIIIFNI